MPRKRSKYPSGANSRRAYANKLNGLSSQARQQIRNLTIDLRYAVKNLKIGRLWYLFIHVVGVSSYSVLSLTAAITFLVVFVMVDFMIGELGKSEPFKSTKGTSVPFNPLRVLGYGIRFIFMALYRLFAGLMGWGSDGAKPIEIPGYILGSIGGHFKPNYTTQFFGYGTLIAVTAYIVQLFIVVYGGH